MTTENVVILSDNEQKMFDAIEKTDLVLLKTVLGEKVNVNVLDSNCMTPLQHASYRGNKDMVQMLLDQGADVNLCEHKHNYTALHFAGLSGNTELCLTLLLNGAKSNSTNTVGRTPAQMAAFVGHHDCVSVINNFLPKSDIEKYCESGKLPQFLSESFHKFVMQVNVHPVKITLNMVNFVGLLEHLGEVRDVLKLMSEKEIQNNEVMSFKFYYLAMLVNEVLKQKLRHVETVTDEKKIDFIELFIRKLLKPGKDLNLEFMDAFLRDLIREFPHRECTLFRQFVATLSSKDSPFALSVISSAINGQRGFMDSVPFCSTCGEEKPSKKCSKCKSVQYCDRNCQRLHWHWHKKSCARLSQLSLSRENSGLEQKKPDPAEIQADIQNLVVSS